MDTFPNPQWATLVRDLIRACPTTKGFGSEEELLGELFCERTGEIPCQELKDTGKCPATGEARCPLQPE